MKDREPPYPQNECEGCNQGKPLVVSPMRVNGHQAACHSPEGWVCTKYTHPDIVICNNCSYMAAGTPLKDHDCTGTPLGGMTCACPCNVYKPAKERAEMGGK